MKNLLLVSLTLSLAAFGQVPGHLLVAVSPELPDALRAETANRVARLLYEGPQGTRVTVLDAGRLADLADAALTESSPRLRQQRQAAAITRVFRTISTNTGTGFNVPVVLDEISRRTLGTNAAVLLIGPAIYRNPKEPAHDLTGGWPSDGHLAAGRDSSVFSTVERAHRLDGIAVHWLVTDADAVVNESHREGLARFWSLFVGTQGGVLATFTPNPGAAFGAVLEGRRTPCLPADLNPSDLAVVLHRRTLAVPQVEEAVVPAAPPAGPAAGPEPGAAAASPLPRAAHGNTGIGIVWRPAAGRSGRVDLDLYVQPPAGGPELCYGETRSAFAPTTATSGSPCPRAPATGGCSGSTWNWPANSFQPRSGSTTTPAADRSKARSGSSTAAWNTSCPSRARQPAATPAATVPTANRTRTGCGSRWAPWC